MGIYYSEKIYGVVCDYFTLKFPNPVNEENMREIKTAYAALTDQQRSGTTFRVYLEASSTYGDDTFITTAPVTDAWFKK